MAKVIMLVGLPCSGKTTWAKANVNDTTAYLSSDAIRSELYGFEDQTHNQEVFKTMNSRAVSWLKEGYDVIYDATNLSRKKRRHFIKNIVKGFPVDCVLFHEDIEVILERNEKRIERTIPLVKMKKMLAGFNVPLYTEGFANITYIGKADTDLLTLFSTEYYMNYDQNSKHHTLTLGNHIAKTYESIWELGFAQELANTMKTRRGGKTWILNKIWALQTTALLHDIGKPFVRSEREDGYSSYIGHENVSTYLSLPYINPSVKDSADHLALLLISYHMRLRDSNTEKATRKLIKEIGQENYDLLVMFRKCDRNAK